MKLKLDQFLSVSIFISRPYHQEWAQVKSKLKSISILFKLDPFLITSPSITLSPYHLITSFQFGRSVQLLLSQSPYRDIAIPWSPFYASDWDAADMFPTFLQMFVTKPNLLETISSPHQVRKCALLKKTKKLAQKRRFQRHFKQTSILSHFISPYQLLSVRILHLNLYGMQMRSILCNFVDRARLIALSVISLINYHFQISNQPLTEEHANRVALTISRASLWDTYRTLFWSDFDLSIYQMEDRLVIS